LCGLSLASLQGQLNDFKGIRVFINPGHGGHDADDRHIGTSDFWESEGNLEKGLYLKQLLEDKKATVLLSRTTNTTKDDLDFTVLNEMVNAANVDFFLSIHSNGGNGQLNRPLVLFRGTDARPVFSTAKQMADTLWQRLWENNNTWTLSGKYVKGDWTFYPDWGKQGLAALRMVMVPSVLSEGSFHDYLPESYRLKNADFMHHEAWAIFRSFESYFGVKPTASGIAAGVVRWADRKASWKVPKTSVDATMPIDSAMVTLLPGDRKYRTDGSRNGFYCFDALKPGTYTVFATAPDGTVSDTLSLSVSADRTTWTDLNVRSTTPTPRASDPKKASKAKEKSKR
jgi:N-acetylmuramoyl-L-alanine amidase